MMHRRAIHGLFATIAVAGAALVLAGCHWTAASADTPQVAETRKFVVPTAADYDAETIERGSYLVTIGGCNDCHTPFKMGPNGPEPDMSRMLQGHPEEVVVASAPVLPAGGPFIWAGTHTNTAFAGPWGVSFARNLTPDVNTGIGSWDETIFMNTIRSGRHWGVARPILPPMPWFNYAKMTDEDLRAVFAYLRSIPPIHNRIPEPLPAPAQPTMGQPPTEAAMATAAGS